MCTYHTSKVFLCSAVAFSQSLNKTSAPSLKVSLFSVSLLLSPPLSPSHSPVLWFRVGFSSATTQTQPVRTDNSCLLFNTVQRASWQAKIWNHFFFIPMIFCMVSHSAFCKAGSNWLEAANLRTFSPLSNVQSCNISKIVFRVEEMPKKMFGHQI